MTILPNQPVPSLHIQTVEHGIIDLQREQPERFTLLVFYRGLHCPKCKEYLTQLTSLRADFTEEGTEILAVSSDSQARAQQAVTDWQLQDLRVGYEFPTDQAHDWGLFVSDKYEDNDKAPVQEPEQFIEPGLFLIRPDQTLYAASIQSMPFARPDPQEVLKALQFIREEDYPARGQAVAA